MLTERLKNTYFLGIFVIGYGRLNQVKRSTHDLKSCVIYYYPKTLMNIKVIISPYSISKKHNKRE